jgi:hypothetical protein
MAGRQPAFSALSAAVEDQAVNADARAASLAAAPAARSMKPAEYFQWTDELDMNMTLAPTVSKPSIARAAYMLWVTHHMF